MPSPTCLPTRLTLAEVDAERVGRAERVADRDLARMLARLVRERRVLRQHGVGAAEQHLRDGVVVTGVALQREADLRSSAPSGTASYFVPPCTATFRPLSPFGPVMCFGLPAATMITRCECMYAIAPACLRRSGVMKMPLITASQLLRVQRGDEPGERRLDRSRIRAPGERERLRHVDVEAGDLAARGGELHRRERRVGAVLEGAGVPASRRRIRRRSSATTARATADRTIELRIAPP